MKYGDTVRATHGTTRRFLALTHRGDWAFVATPDSWRTARPGELDISTVPTETLELR